MKNILPKKNQGFTLIEMIVYLAITSLILISITSLLVNILFAQTKNNIGSEVNYNLSYLNNYLVRDISQSNGINAISSTTLILGQPGKVVTYAFDRDKNILTKKINSEPEIKMHTDQVSVRGSFTDNSFLDKAKNVGVVLEIFQANNSSNLNDFNASTSAAFSVELRGKK